MKLHRDVQSLSTFKRDTSKFLKQMRETGEPLVLTVNGKPAAVVLDPEDFELMQERERLATIAAVNRGLADFEAGRVMEADVFFRDFEARHNIPPEE